MNVLSNTLDEDSDGVVVNPSNIITIFNHLVFGLDSNGVLSKWESSNQLKLFVHGEYSDKHLSLVDRVLSEFNSVSKLDAKRLTNHKEGYNVFLNITNSPFYDYIKKYKDIYARYYTNESLYLRDIRTAEKHDKRYGVNSYHLDKTSQIVVANITLPVDINYFEKSLGENMMNVFGFNFFSNKNNLYDYSLLNSMCRKYGAQSGDSDHLLTTIDMLLLKILYDPRINSGMRFSEVQPILMEAVNDYM